MVVDGAHRARQAPRDLGIAQAAARQHQHLQLAGRQAVRMLACRGASAALEPAHVGLAQAPAQGLARRLCAEALEERQRLLLGVAVAVIPLAG